MRPNSTVGRSQQKRCGTEAVGLHGCCARLKYDDSWVNVCIACLSRHPLQILRTSPRCSFLSGDSSPLQLYGLYIARGGR